MVNKRIGRVALASVAVAGVVGGVSAGVTGGFGLSSAAAAASAAQPVAAPAVAASPVAVTSAATTAATTVATTVATTAATAAKIAAVPTAATPGETAEERSLDAYFAHGYTYDDAVALAKLWHDADPFTAKVAAGRKLQAGETLPLAAGSSPTTPADAVEADPTAAFFDAGYTYTDAVTLASLWHKATPYDAKVAAATKLAAGETLPIAP